MDHRNAINLHFNRTRIHVALVLILRKTDLHLTPFLNSLPNEQISNWSKLKASADDKIKVLQIIIFGFDRVENTVVKGENAGYKHFLLFP